MKHSYLYDELCEQRMEHRLQKIENWVIVVLIAVSVVGLAYFIGRIIF